MIAPAQFETEFYEGKTTCADRYKNVNVAWRHASQNHARAIAYLTWKHHPEAWGAVTFALYTYLTSFSYVGSNEYIQKIVQRSDVMDATYSKHVFRMEVMQVNFRRFAEEISLSHRLTVVHVMELDMSVVATIAQYDDINTISFGWMAIDGQSFPRRMRYTDYRRCLIVEIDNMPHKKRKTLEDMMHYFGRYGMDTTRLCQLREVRNALSLHSITEGSYAELIEVSDMLARRLKSFAAVFGIRRLYFGKEEAFCAVTQNIVSMFKVTAYDQG
jgi:hypothetical protein